MHTKLHAQQTIKKMIVNGTNIMGAKIIVMGLTFKENCSDLRNSKVADLVQDLQDFGCEVCSRSYCRVRAGVT